MKVTLLAVSLAVLLGSARSVPSAPTLTDISCDSVGSAGCTADRTARAVCDTGLTYALFPCPTGTECHRGYCILLGAPIPNHKCMKQRSPSPLRRLTKKSKYGRRRRRRTSPKPTDQTLGVSQEQPPTSAGPELSPEVPSQEAQPVPSDQSSVPQPQAVQPDVPASQVSDAAGLPSSGPVPTPSPAPASTPTSVQTPAAPVTSGPAKTPAANPRQESSGGALFTCEEFNKAFTLSGYPVPNPAYCPAVQKNLGPVARITTKTGAAMFIAQTMWESDGYRATEEYACQQTKCPGQYYTAGQKDSCQYFGRGLMQLSWLDNYRACSQGLFGDDRLVDNPDMVAQDFDLSVKSACWFWSVNVQNTNGVSSGQFGATTKAINGALECTGASPTPQKRYNLYLNTLEAFGLDKSTASPAGC